MKRSGSLSFFRDVLNCSFKRSASDVKVKSIVLHPIFLLPVELSQRILSMLEGSSVQ